MSLDNLLTRLVIAVEKLAGIETTGNGAIITTTKEASGSSGGKPRGRPRKEEAVAATTPAQVEQEPEPESELSLDGEESSFLDTDSEPEPEKQKEVTLEMVRDKLVEVQKLPGCSKWPLEELAKHGAQTLGKLPKDKYLSVYNSAVKRLSVTKAAK